MQRRGAWGVLLAAWCWLSFAPAIAAGKPVPLRVLAGPEGSGQAQMARELANVLSASAGVKAQAAVSAGTVDTLFRLHDERGLRLGWLSADVAAAYQSAAARGHAAAASLLAPLRVIAALPPASVHVLVRAESDYLSFADLREARINLGPANGQTALSAMQLYRSFFAHDMPEGRASFFTHEQALARLVTEHSLDAVVIVAEQPARIIADMKPEARRYVRLIGLPAAAFVGSTLPPVYVDDRLQAAHYASLLDADVDSLAVQAVLVAEERRPGANDTTLVAVAKAFCEGLPKLQQDGHAGWKRATLAPPANVAGWHYAAPAVLDEIGRCSGGLAALPLPASCSAEDRVLQLCD